MAEHANVAAKDVKGPSTGKRGKSGVTRARVAVARSLSTHQPPREALREVQQVENGIPKIEASRLFEKIAAVPSQSAAKLRAQIIPDSSWKRSGDRLRPTASQTTARLERVLGIAENIWQSERDAIAWLTGGHMELGGATPYSLLRTEAGGRAVENILAAIDYGFPA
jgi:putative toxin-antitoxin system antitoxin component (TIGR02293 family)